MSFLEFLNLSPKPCVLLAHNASFDASFLMRTVSQYKMVSDYQKIAGFCDSLSLIKKELPTRKGQFKLGALARDYLRIESREKFHDTLYDVQILKGLTLSILNIYNVYGNTKS